jgi:tetratricopeptide (TPR) repeat protein
VVGFLWSLPAVDHGPVLDDAALLAQDDVPVAELLGRGLFAGVRDYGGYYRPLTALSFRPDLPPSVHHLINGLLHGAVVALAFQVLSLLLGGGFVPFAAAALFAVHPVHVDAVDPITGRGDLLAALFLLLAWWAFDAVERRGAWSAVLCALAFAAALLSKESAVVLPLLLLAGEWMVRPHRVGQAGRMRWVAVAGVLLAYVILRMLVLGGLMEPGLPDPLDNPLVGASLAERLIRAPVAWFEALRLLVWPASMSPDYSGASLGLGSGLELRPVAGWAAVLLAAGAWLLSVRRRGASFLGLTVLLVGLAPLANLLFPAPLLIAARVLYLPSLGMTLLVAAGLAATPRRVGVVLLLVLVTAWTWLSLELHPHYADDLAVWSRAVDQVPGNGKAWYNLGNARMRQGDPAGALEAWARSTEVQPDLALAWSNLGLGRARAGDEEGARRDLETAIRLDPGLAQAHAALGSLAARSGDVATARRHLRKALALDPGGPEAARIRAVLDALDTSP